MTELTKDQVQETDQQHHLQLYKRYPVTLERGEGSYVWDSRGKKYIDALAGIAVNSTGHCHPKVVKAVQQQVGQLIHISNFFVSKPQADLAKRLTGLSGLDRAFFSNSGAEAVEAAFKLARKYGHTNNKGGHIISMNGCFHGRTLGTIAPGKAKYKAGFEPVMPGFTQVSFNDIEAVRDAITPETTAVIVEPVQGEGGIHVAEKRFLQELRQLCDEKGLLLILDEIQCGVGRTGKMFAFEHAGIKPDILTLAKALGSGIPIGATVCTQKVADAISYGQHGTTYGGNPVACTAALVTLDVMEEENLVQAAAEKGQKTMKLIRERAKAESAVKEVRGLGLMIGVELQFEGKDVTLKMLEQGVIANCASETVIRLVPPLNISQDDLKTVVNVMFDSIRALKSKQ